MYRAVLTLCLCLAVSTVTTVCAVAQTPVPKPAEAGVEEVGPATVYLKDENGKLVPVPGISYERFRELLLLEKKTGAVGPPPFVVEKLLLKGTEKDKTLEAEVEVAVQVRSADWVRIPLRMNGGILRGDVVHEPSGEKGPQGPGEIVHGVDPAEGHIVWIKAEKDSRHVIKLPFSIPLQDVVGERRFLLATPRANDGRFSLRLSPFAEDVAMSSGEGILSLTKEADAVVTAVHGAGGDLSISWRLEKKGEGTEFQDLIVDSTITAKFESRDVAAVEARLQAKRAVGRIASLWVRLPPRMTAVPTSSTVYRIGPAEEADLKKRKLLGDKPSPGKIVRIDWDRPTSAVDFTLQTTVDNLAWAKRELLELGGFEVLGALRQGGVIETFVPSGWQIKPTLDASVSRADSTAAATEPRSAGTFRFSRQPFSFKVEAVPQPARISVEPEYRLFLEPRRIYLEALFRYRVRGPLAEFLDLECGDWRIETVEPDDLVAPAAPSADGKTTRLTLDPSAGEEFEIRLRAFREVGVESKVSFLLPRAVSIQPQPALVTVSGAENLSIVPLPREMPALTADVRSSEPQAKRTNAWSFREVPSNEPIRFAAEMKILPRRVTAQLASTAIVGADRTAIETNWLLHVAHEPLETFACEFPREAKIADFQVFLDDQALPTPEPSPGDESLETLVYAVKLPEPRSGEVRLRTRYVVPRASDAGMFELPLLLPPPDGETTVSEQRLVIKSDSTRQPMPADEEGGETTDLGTEGISVRWFEPKARIRLREDRRWGATASGASASRAWLQIWLNGAVRRDRFTVRLEGVSEELKIQLPAGASAADVRVAVDGKPLENWFLKGERLHLPAAAVAGRQHTLELWYLSARNAPTVYPARYTLATPRLVDISAPPQTFVQTILPPGEALLFHHGDYQAQLAWRKEGRWWRRAGRFSTAELESWAGANDRDEFSPTGNDYLFATLGEAGAIQVIAAPRRMLMLFSAVAALGIGTMLARLSRRRRNLIVLLLGLALGLVGVLYTEALLACGEGLVLGTVLWLLLKRSAVTRTPSPAPFAPTPSTRSAPTASRSGRDRPPSSVTATTPHLASPVVPGEPRS